MALTQVDQGMLGAQAQYNGFKNRIINGAMVIDQRNAGASVSNLDGYAVDRWYSSWTGSSTGRVSAQQTTTAPAGFSNSFLLTVTATSASPASNEGNFFYQSIEGFNTADLAFGTASAQTVTISFWVRFSVTGTFPLILANSGRTRQFGATYTINSANTWEYKTITVAGDTSGTWLTSNGIGMTLIFGLSGGSGRTISTGWQTTAGFCTNVTGCTNFMATSGATLNITGVQLEKGSTATSFDYRPYGTELALCQRYCYAQVSGGAAYYSFGISSSNGTTPIANIKFPVTMRISPSISSISSGTTFIFASGSPSTISVDQVSPDNAWVYGSGGSSGTGGYSGRFLANNTSSAYIIWSSEL